MFDFGGPLSFGAAAELGHRVREKAQRAGSDAIVLDFSTVPFMDVSAARAVETIASDAIAAGKKVYVTGMREEVAQVLEGLEADHHLPPHVRFERRADALRAAAADFEPGPTPARTPKLAVANG